MAAFKFVIVAAVLASAVALTPITPADTRRAALEERIRLAEKECSVDNLKPRGPGPALCFTMCLFKTLGVLDKDGRYVESGMADLLWVVGGLNEEKSNIVATRCNTLNEKIEPGCERARQVSFCTQAETEKLNHNSTQSHITGVQNA